MKPSPLRPPLASHFVRQLAIFCSLLLLPGDSALYAMPIHTQATADTQEAAKTPPEQLDALVAPIALYPDPMLAQVLAASTYPLEIIQLQQWLEKNKNLKDKALVDAVSKQPWDASVQALAALPDVVKRLASDIQWTTDLGNAFLTQQSDVMDAVQRMRKKAKDNGNLKTTEQQKVETKVIENKQVIIVEQASPEVVYVPSYNPVVVYGPPVYPYPPIAYPPPGYYAAGLAISFGVGVAMGAAWSGGWGWGCGWGHNDVDINVNNNFNRNTNVNGGNRVSTQPSRGAGNRTGTSGGKWQHNPQHRGGAPYSNRATAQKYGGTARGDSLATRQANARDSQAQRGNRQQPGVSDRSRQPGGVGDRSAGGRQQAGVSDRSAAGGSAGNRGGAGGVDRGGAGGDRVGNREVPRGSSSTNRSAFSGSSGGMNGGAARASSQRGSSSLGSRGGSRGGGGRRR
jgi:hypothetical protein